MQEHGRYRLQLFSSCYAVLHLRKGGVVEHVIDVLLVRAIALIDRQRTHARVLQQELRQVRAHRLAGETTAEKQIWCHPGATVAWPLICRQAGQFTRRLDRHGVTGIVAKCDIAQQRCPVELDEFGGVLIAGDGGCGWHRELTAIQALQFKRQTALGTVQRACSPQLDCFKIGGVAAIQSFAKGQVGSRIDTANAGLQDAFGIGPTLIGIARFVSIVYLRGRGDGCVIAGEQRT